MVQSGHRLLLRASCHQISKRCYLCHLSFSLLFLPLPVSVVLCFFFLFSEFLMYLYCALLSIVLELATDFKF